MNTINRMIKSELPYCYETHFHTKESSACSQNTAEELVYAYKEAGYTGIIVTDHFYRGNCAVDRNMPWEDWAEAFFRGYENAKTAGEKIGLQVFSGWEESYQGNDFLVYGLDKEWVKKHPELKEVTVEEQYELIHRAGGMVIHAHPFREAWYVPEIRLFPSCVDGVEIFNASHYEKDPGEDGRSLFDVRALDYALKHNLAQTGGSDIHSVNLLYGGMAFARKLDSIQDYIKAVLAGEGKPMDYFMLRDSFAGDCV